MPFVLYFYGLNYIWWGQWVVMMYVVTLIACEFCDFSSFNNKLKTMFDFLRFWNHLRWSVFALSFFLSFEGSCWCLEVIAKSIILLSLNLEDNKTTINTTGWNLGSVCSREGKYSDGCDGVLVSGLQIGGNSVTLSTRIQLLEHLESGLVAWRFFRWGIDFRIEFPVTSLVGETVGFTVVTGSNDSVLWDPCNGDQR